jgi:7-carboxy-7-deazaguanine synthase
VSLRVAEIFGPTVQGEGPLIGTPTVFVRLGGCDYRCAWCDSMHAVDPANRHEWARMSVTEVINKVEDLARGVCLITVSGGNPALYDLTDLIMRARIIGHRLAMETQGSVARSWFGRLDSLVLSPKPPSAAIDFDLDALHACVTAGPTQGTALKVVVADDADYEFARKVHSWFPRLPFFVQPCNAHTLQDDSAAVLQRLSHLKWLMERVAADRWWECRVLPQLHVLAWGNERGR